ncbi:bifunctional adenosylcobinamide kinase/adenosylcobinamide-phosphate guanylyltransferase [Paraglaciecola aquimarina]|uniref:Bifunctional adenosylcobalamin biosynthesis protein n=1 Tax=Paraglaciecola aquimarina TaxID=1235557 RepID=A0ABU3T116_9ALTE|nr:bifunctional adenosylcobinamide kinase/adenosylcobinamide-phosphate guanylyltransferase [Paraglaciecola aquimarina]MDU0355964.1 bifunctional adenosylcobinamide kinase/adenosylcobinamide-phosphate guanylyltransferase [Paraglaciecola aquimarina]
MIHLVLGGARSGKSSFSLEQVKKVQQDTGKAVTFVATATVTDHEMASRIAQHQSERPSNWQLAEVPLALDTFIAQQKDSILLIDCLTLWLNNHLYQRPKQDFKKLIDNLVSALSTSQCHILLVSNEVGLGIIPMGEVTRQFVDQAGWLNQAIAKAADQVTFVAAGLPMMLKGNR